MRVMFATKLFANMLTGTIAGPTVAISAVDA
jgi:hypothetical protein